MVGTGSFLPEIWSETYATADIVAYDGEVTPPDPDQSQRREPGRQHREAGGEILRIGTHTRHAAVGTDEVVSHRS